MKTLFEAIDEWTVKYKRTSVKAGSYDRLRRSLEAMSKYRVSRIPIDKLTSDDLQDYINELVDDGYALTTIKKQYHLIGEFITYANLKDLIIKPLHKGVKLPSESSVKKQKKEVIAYTKEEQRALLEILSTGEHPAYYLAVLMMETGLRIGEAIALSWRDIDWRRRALKVNKTVVHLGNSRKSFIQMEPKSYSSIRTVPLSTRVYDLLSYMNETNDSRSDIVFHTEDGRYLTYEAVRWQIGKACTKAGVPYYGQHVFRHTFATNCYERGCDVKVLSKLLGHSDVTITYNVYIHLFGDALEEMRLVVG